MTTQITYPAETPPSEGDAIEIAHGILWLRPPLPMALDHVNVYALEDETGWTIIDTGFHSKRGVRLWEKLLSGPLAGKPVSRVVVTHHHPDHVGMAGWFQSQTGAELLMTRTAWLMARMLQLDVQERPSDEALLFYRRAGMSQDEFATRKDERPFNFADCTYPLPQGFTRLTEGMSLTLGRRRWTVRIGHGHAPCHATLWSETDDIVIGGDQLLPSISPNLGVYPTEPMADPVAEWLESCEKFSRIATDRQLVLPGHKLPFFGLPFRLAQKIDNHHGALKRLLDFLDTPKSAGDCFLPLFKREISGSQYGLALVESIAHLNHLYLCGKVTRDISKDGAYIYQRKGES